MVKSFLCTATPRMANIWLPYNLAPRNPPCNTHREGTSDMIGIEIGDQMESTIMVSYLYRGFRLRHMERASQLLSSLKRHFQIKRLFGVRLKNRKGKNQWGETMVKINALTDWHYSTPFIPHKIFIQQRYLSREHISSKPFATSMGNMEDLTNDRKRFNHTIN